jgi:hypothetical protein
MSMEASSMPRGKLTIYLSGPMTGKTMAEALDWRRHAAEALTDAGFNVLDPLRGLSAVYKPNDILGGTSGEHELGMLNHSWFMRDKFDVMQADILLVNLCGASKVSIGTVMEIAWAFIKGTYIIIAIEPEGDNPHHHIFVNECACKLTDTPKDGVDYILTTFKN